MATRNGEFEIKGLRVPIGEAALLELSEAAGPSFDQIENAYRAGSEHFGN